MLLTATRCMRLSNHGGAARRRPARSVLHNGLPIAPRRAPRDVARAALGLPADAFVCGSSAVSTSKGQDVLIRALADPALAPTGPSRSSPATRGRARSAGSKSCTRSRPPSASPTACASAGFAPTSRTSTVRPTWCACPRSSPTRCQRGARGRGRGLLRRRRESRRATRDPARRHDGDARHPRRPAALAAALAALHDDPARRERLGAAAAADVRERFAPALLLERAQALYDDVMARRRSAPR